MSNGKFSQTVSLAEEIEHILRERILKGEYGIGERIKENQIAEELKVSRTPIREAFKQLEKEGLIESIPNRGSFALGLTKQDVKDIYAVRAAVEVLAVEWAIPRISDEEILRLRDAFERMEFYTGRQDSKKVLELNKTFHEIIYSASGSRFLTQILKSYQEYVEKTRKATVYCSDNLPIILEEHRGILEAIQDKNKAKAVQRISAHLSNSRKRAEQSLNL
ncbi:MAG: GntR family transcriptional regulator [Clostridiales bacterium]|jgi:DNA-binding GntR family transcriptional regulator|nr:GntR family transcriptional regulator [Clostridiales bacterium]